MTTPSPPTRPRAVSVDDLRDCPPRLRARRARARVDVYVEGLGAVNLTPDAVPLEFPVSANPLSTTSFVLFGLFGPEIAPLLQEKHEISMIRTKKSMAPGVGPFAGEVIACDG